MTHSSTDFAALRGLRIGCVRYLNSRPLIEPYDGPVVLDHPSALAAALERGELDVALVPVYEALRMPECRAVEGVSISALGPVWSVILAYQGALDAVRQVALDPASRTSVHLCKVLFAEWGGGPIPEDLPEPAPPGAARVLIGNQAIAFREKHEGEWKILDIARRGQLQMEEIIARQREHPAEFVRRYLTEFIRFGLGVGEKRGIEQFRTLLCKHALLPPGTGALKFV